jgi:hypothetical protein
MVAAIKGEMDKKINMYTWKHWYNRTIRVHIIISLENIMGRGILTS